MITAVALVPAAADWIAVARRDRRAEYLFKPLTMAVLIGLVWAAGAPGWLLAALVLSLAGDTFLMLDRFLPGLASFLVAHAAYLAAFGVPGTPAGIVPVVLGAFVVFGPILRGVAGTTLFWPVLAYATVISAMVVAAFGAGLLAASGALLFYASDAMIGWSRFVRTFRADRLAIMVTYHLAQVLLGASLLP